MPRELLGPDDDPRGVVMAEDKVTARVNAELGRVADLFRRIRRSTPAEDRQYQANLASRLGYAQAGAGRISRQRTVKPLPSQLTLFD